MRENMRYVHYWQICARMFAISWHAWLSIDCAAPSRDLLLAQASIDGTTIDGSRCAIDG